MFWLKRRDWNRRVKKTVVRCFIVLTQKHIIKVVKSRRVGNITLMGKKKLPTTFWLRNY